MGSFRFFDANTGESTESIELFFENWTSGERVMVFSPHDDDGIIGAGYAMRAAMENGAKVYVTIFCRGNAGYSSVDDKLTIESTRKKETLEAYAKIGIPQEDIFYLDFSDFAVCRHHGWKGDGSFETIIRMLREKRITRLLIPNHYKEHSDHTAASMMGMYDAPQAGDPVLVDWGAPSRVKTVMEYAVWSELSPEDALIAGRDTALRANRIILADEAVEALIAQGIREYRSQGAIIDGLVSSRSERRVKNGGYVEAYILVDPRPKMNLKAYTDFVNARL